MVSMTLTGPVSVLHVSMTPSVCFPDVNIPSTVSIKQLNRCSAIFVLRKYVNVLVQKEKLITICVERKVES